MPTNIRTSWHFDKNKNFYPTRFTNLLNVELSKIDNWDNIFRFNSIFDLLKGEMAEWSIASDLKSDESL